MYIPLDRLYHFIEKLANKIYDNPVIIYRFWPHGSKNLQDLNSLKQCDWAQRQQMPGIWCHDQEPLAPAFAKRNIKCTWVDLLASLDLVQPRTRLNWYTNVFKKNILLHSEKRSFIIDKYLTNEDLIPVYYWSHAVIALDWFRYAKHQDYNKNISKKFLVYNRAWSGTREYRLRFADRLIEHHLVDHCLTFCNPTDDGKHYETHTFQNPVWQPGHVLENYLAPSQADSRASADFDAQDYKSTQIEVVLETLFDDDRLHLTEKSLRPIACRQPFILAATHGSLQYLRDYGFKTFDTIWDETYDTIEDPYQRMQAIIKLMREITTWSDVQRRDNIQQMQLVADHNHNHFFSKDFSDLIIDELRTNMTEAFDQIKQDLGFDKWLDKWQHFLQFAQVQDFLDFNQDITQPTRQQYEQVLEFIGHYPKTIADANKI
jgi:hypothetical protein